MFTNMFLRLIHSLLWFYYWAQKYLHRIAKVFMRRVTRLTELQRIMYGEVRGSRRIRKIEASLNESQNPYVKRALEEMDRGIAEDIFCMRGTRKELVTRCAVEISKAKCINLKLHSKFVNGLIECLEVIYTFKCLNSRLKINQETMYSTLIPEHEEMLLNLWTNLMLNETLSARKSRQWQDIGFQGVDPATDFRGAGILALRSLLYISSSYPDVAQYLLQNSHHPMYSYPFALLVIQITYLSCNLCLEGYAKTHFYNRWATILRLDDNAGPTDRTVWGNELLKLFYEFCTALVIDFDSLWMSSKPKDIMEYSRIKGLFDASVLRKLRDDNTCFLMDVRTI